jgi:osmoprotectant transport system permease protein
VKGTALIWFYAWILAASDGAATQKRPTIIGSKKFTESYVLGELARHELERNGLPVEHRQGMGGTIVLWEALKQGSIAAYPDYTGTICEEILKTPTTVSLQSLRESLAKFGVGVTEELGFNNTYALVMRRADAGSLAIHKISDLSKHRELKLGFTHEFLGRRDGWQPLQARYGLALPEVRGIDHTLGYLALANRTIDVKDAYSTDAKVAVYDLVTLQDDLKFFPQYQAVFLYRLDAPKSAIKALRLLEGSLNESNMIRLNAFAEQTKDYAAAASLFLNEQTSSSYVITSERVWRKLVRWTARHLLLVTISLCTAVVVGIPLGIYASNPGPISHAILATTGLIQTIPSLALLALLVAIPFLGISPTTAIVALSLYGLLPIVRNTASGLQSIPLPLKESAAVLGLKPMTQLLRIYLPMAAPTILAGIQSSAVINVGSATLAALIGAGGLGEPIISGLNLNDHATILQGAIPAALLAILIQALFSGLDHLFIPKGLRIKPT